MVLSLNLSETMDIVPTNKKTYLRDTPDCGYKTLHLWDGRVELLPELTQESFTCFTCGKQGHMAKDCRSKQIEPTKQTMIPGRDLKPIVCFVFKEVGHKSPQCPNRQREKVKKVKIQAHLIEKLAANDVIASLNSNCMPMMMD